MRIILISWTVAICSLAIACDRLAAQGNAPQIQSLSPSSALAGTRSITLAVGGNGFGNAGQGAVVRWNGLDRPTTYVSFEELKITLGASDLAQAGTAEVTVFLPLGRGTSSTPVVFSINNPKPNIGSLAPAALAAGGKSAELTVTGSGFVDGVSVQVNGTRRSTTRVSATEIRANLTSIDLAAPANKRVTVVNPAPGGGASDPYGFTVVELPRITAFTIGGSSDPERVWAGQAVSLRATGSGGTPTHWRLGSSSAALQTATWRGMRSRTTMTYAFDPWRANDCGVGNSPNVFLRQEELHFQYAIAVGIDTLASAPSSDGVVVRLPWCDPVRIYTPPAIGGYPASKVEHSICPAGEVLNGVRYRYVNVSSPVPILVHVGHVVTAVGGICNGSNQPMIGAATGTFSTPINCAPSQVPRVIIYPRGNIGGLSTTYLKDILGLCMPTPTGLSPTHDRLYISPVGGTVSGSNPWNLTCPSRAVPIGLTVYRGGSTTLTVPALPPDVPTGMALICVRAD